MLHHEINRDLLALLLQGRFAHVDLHGAPQKIPKLRQVSQTVGGVAQVFYTLARGVVVYRRYLVVAAVLVCAAIMGGLIQWWIRRS